MTSNIRIVRSNFHDDATLAASEAASGFPITNTQTDARDTVWRSTTTGTVTITGTFSRNRIVNAFGMFDHRNHGGSIRLELFTDAAWTVPATGGDTGTVAINKVVGSSSDTADDWGDDPYGIGGYDPLITDSPYWYWFANPVTIRSYKITLSSHSSTFWSGPYWQISKLVLGKYFQPRVNPSYGAGLGRADNTDRNRTRGGSLRTDLGETWRVMKMTLDAIDEDEVPIWNDILANSRTGRSMMVSLFPEDGTRKERDAVGCFKFSTLDVIGRQVSRLTTNLQLEEI